jgi:hypothetical protein
VERQLVIGHQQGAEVLDLNIGRAQAGACGAHSFGHIGPTILDR